MTAARTHERPYRAVYSPRWAQSVPEDNHADQDEGGGNNIPDKVHPMDALTTTKAVVFVLDIKTILALHITNQPRQKTSMRIIFHCCPEVTRQSKP